MTKIQAKQAVSEGISPADLLKAVVTGKAEVAPAATASVEPPAGKGFARPFLSRLDHKRLALPGARQSSPSTIAAFGPSGTREV